MGLGSLQRLLHECGLTLIVVLVEGRQEYRPSVEMIVDHGFGDTGLFCQVPQCQGLGALFANYLPGHAHQLLQALFPCQATAR